MSLGAYDYQAVPAGTYDFHRNHWSPRFLWHHRKFLAVMESVKEILDDQSPICILDLGCGSGVFLRDYVDDEFIKVGYDISEAQLNYGRVHDKQTFFSNSLDVIVQFINELPKNVKVICVSIELLEHLSKEEVAEINEFLRAIEKSFLGVICTTPNRESFWPILEKIIDRFLGTDYNLQHTNLMNASEFKVVSQLLSEGLFGASNVRVGSILGFAHWLLGWKSTKCFSDKSKKMILIYEQKKTIISELSGS